MTCKFIRTAGIVGIVIAGGAFSRSARAQDDASKAACISAAEESEHLRVQGKIEAAHQQLLKCAQAACPTIVKENCERWLTEVLTLQSTVVFAARDSDGHDLVAVSVSVDGVEATKALDGHVVPVDAGVHAISFRRADGKTVDEQIVIRESEKARVILATFPNEKAKDATATPPPKSDSGSSAPIFGYVVGGVGIALAAVGGYFGVVQYTDAQHLQSTCSPNCKPGDVDSIRTERTLGWIFGGASVVALGAATYLILSHHDDKSRAASAIDIDVRGVGTHGSILTVTGKF